MTEATTSPTARTLSAKPLLRVLRGETVERPPVWLMRQAGRYLPEYRALREKANSFLEFCYSPALAIEATLQPVHRFGFDAAILFSDILVVPEALGAKVWFEEGVGPRLEPVTTGAAIAALQPGRVVERLSPVYETVSGLSGRLPPDVALIGFAGAPWTVATYMIAGEGSKDQAPARVMAYRRRLDFEGLIECLIEATTAHLVAQIEAGAEVVQIFDTWAGALAPAEFERWGLRPVQAIVRAVKKRHPDVPIIGFPRGIGVSYERFAMESGVDAVGLDTSVPLDWARTAVQARLPVQGNLDPCLLAAGGDRLVSEVEAICTALRGGPHIFNLGHGILPQTPPENVAVLVKAVRGAAG